MFTAYVKKSIGLYTAEVCKFYMLEPHRMSPEHPLFLLKTSQPHQVVGSPYIN